MESLSFRKSLGQLQSSIEQRCTGVPTAPIGANIYIQGVNSLRVVQRGVGFSQFKKKLFAIHHYTTAITSVSIKISKVWEYYEKLGKDEAKCLLCKKVVSCKASSTTGSIRHLEGNY